MEMKDFMALCIGGGRRSGHSAPIQESSISRADCKNNGSWTSAVLFEMNVEINVRILGALSTGRKWLLEGLHNSSTLLITGNKERLQVREYVSSVAQETCIKWQTFFVICHYFKGNFKKLCVFIKDKRP